MNICVTILAWNEAASIAATIRSIARQSIFGPTSGRSDRLEVLCVPNGCTDDTAQVAAETLSSCFDDSITTGVCPLTQAGKANAWSQTVHVLAAADTEAFIFLDADVLVHHPDSLRNMIACLEESADVHAVAARTIKHTELADHRSILDRISLYISKFRQARPVSMAGCLYCARASSLRRIWLPPGLIGEDVLLRKLILTDVLRHPADLSRIVRANDASVVFESYRSIAGAFRTLKRRAMTAAINAFFMESLGDEPERRSELLIERSRQNPAWFTEVVRQRLEDAGWWVMPKGLLMLRFRQLKHVPWRRRLFFLPIAAVDGSVHVLACLSANHSLRKQQTAGAWADTRTTAFR